MQSQLQMACASQMEAKRANQASTSALAVAQAELAALHAIIQLGPDARHPSCQAASVQADPALKQSAEPCQSLLVNPPAPAQDAEQLFQVPGSSDGLFWVEKELCHLPSISWGPACRQQLYPVLLWLPAMTASSQACSFVLHAEARIAVTQSSVHQLYQLSTQASLLHAAPHIETQPCLGAQLLKFMWHCI